MAGPAFLVLTLFCHMALLPARKRDLFGALICLSRLLGWPKRAYAFFPEYIQEKTHTLFLAKGIIVHVLPIFMCFQGDSNVPPEICFLQFFLAFKASSLPSLNIFVDERYHLKLCRFVNCSAPELHFSTRFFGSWPQRRRIPSGPLLVLAGRLSLCLILLPDGKIE